MKYYATVIAGITSTLLIFGFISQAFAADMTALIVPEKPTAIPKFTGVKNLTIRYPEGSSISKELNGKSDRIEFTVNGTAKDANVADLIQATTQALRAVSSPVQVTGVNVHYLATIKGSADTALMSVKVIYEPTFEKIVLSKGDTQAGGDIIDLQWREIVVQGPVKLSTANFGQVNINQAIGALEAKYPDLAAKLNTNVLQEPVLDFNTLKNPMSDSWHHLFDPISTYGSGTITNSDYGTAKVLSVYSLGESSIREGTFESQETTATATVDGASVNIKSLTPPPSAQVTVAGYLDVKSNQGQEYGIVSTDAPAGAVTSSGGFPIQVLLVLGGMMGAVAIFVLWKARK